jgi:hypothetical protein
VRSRIILVSGNNNKTVGGISLLGSGDIPNSTAQYVFSNKELHDH